MRRPKTDTALQVSIHAPARGATICSRAGLCKGFVSIHAPARGATSDILHHCKLLTFQSTRPRGARQFDRMKAANPAVLFQSTRPRGARLPVTPRMMRICLFQSTRPRGARRPLVEGAEIASQRFNPRAREGRDRRVCFSRDSPKTFQSTRPRGARPLVEGAEIASQRFNPRAREGRDLCSQTRHLASCGFNPRAREGRDSGTCIRTRSPRVSIHAPARGATPLLSNTTSCFVRFQSTRPRGARPCRRLSDGLSILFQSTRPRGARPGGSGDTAPLCAVSIHAPARGATWRPRNRIDDGLFQSTRPRGARRGGHRESFRLRRFNPRAREGRDASATHEVSNKKCFNPRAREGRDCAAPVFVVLFGGFNPRAREGRDHADNLL